MSQLDKHNTLQDLLRDASEGFSVPPPAAAWQHIEQALQPEKKRRRFIWLLLPLLVGAGITCWLTLRNGRQPAITAQYIPSQPGTHSKNTAVMPPGKPAALNQQTPLPVQEATAPPVNQAAHSRSNTPGLPRRAVAAPAITTTEDVMMEEEAGAEDAAVFDTHITPLAITDNAEPAPIAEPEKKEPFSDDYIDSAKDAKQRLAAATPVAPAVIAKKPKWRVLANATVGTGFHSLAYESPMKANNLFRTDTRSRVFINHLPHRVGIAGGAGINLQYQLNRKLAIETGLEYFTTGYTINAYQVSPIEINFRSAAFAANTISTRLNSSYASIVSNALNNFGGGSGPGFNYVNPVKTKLINRYHFLGLPLQAVYQPASKHRLSFVMRAGVALEWRLNTQRANYILSPEQGRYFTDPSLQQKWNMAVNLQPGVNLRLQNGRNLQMGLAGKLYASSTYGKDVPLKEYLFATGIQLHYDLWQSKK